MATLSKASNRNLSTDETQSWRWNTSQMILHLTLSCVSATSWFVNIWDEDCMTLDDLRCIKVCQRKMIACKLVFSCNIPSTDLLLMATSTIFSIYSWQMGFAKSSDKWLVIKKQQMHLSCVLQVCFFNKHLWRSVCTYVINIFRRAVLFHAEVLLSFWEGCTTLKPEIAQVPLVINIRQTLAGC